MKIPIYLDVMLRKFLRKRPPPRGQGVYGVVYRNLALFMIQEMINILTALSHNLLAE